MDKGTMFDLTGKTALVTGEATVLDKRLPSV